MGSGTGRQGSLGRRDDLQHLRHAGIVGSAVCDQRVQQAGQRLKAAALALDAFGQFTDGHAQIIDRRAPRGEQRAEERLFTFGHPKLENERKRSDQVVRQKTDWDRGARVASLVGFDVIGDGRGTARNGISDEDREKRRAVGMRAGLFDLVVAMRLEDLGQFPAAVEAGDAREVCGRKVGNAVHACRLSVGGRRAVASEWEKPPRCPDRDIGSDEFLQGVAKPPDGALIAFARRRLGQAKFDGDFGLGEAFDRHADHEG